MQEHSIGEIARRANIAASAIRYYESIGLLPTARRRGGRRVYSDDVLDRLALIAVAKRAGFTVAETGKLLRGLSGRAPGQRWRTLATAKVKELDDRIREADPMKRVLEFLARCECPSLADCGAAVREATRGNKAK